MPLLSSIFLILSLALAVVFGPQMRAWSWGPALLALAVALGCAAVVHLRAKRPLIEPVTLMLGLLTTLWFAWRAWVSPVAELAHADLLLLAGAVGSFLCVRAISTNPRAEAIFLWGLAGLLLASVVMVGFQIGNPDWSQFRQRPAGWPSAFYGHYNEGANFLIGAAFVLLGAGLFGANRRSTTWLWLLIGVVGVAAVYFTRSRGAILGIVVAIGLLGLIVLIIGARRKSRWFAPAMISFPILVLGAGIALMLLWNKTIDYRSEGTSDVSGMLDNKSRLRNYSLAFETIMLHPLAGGGSRSYSWDSLQVWDPTEHGNAFGLPEQTHNEILQAATDYGLFGAMLLVGLLAWLGVRTVWKSRFDDDDPPGHSGMGIAHDALRVGGFAALGGMLVQSSFSFVFHLLPGAMLLGIAMARVADGGVIAQKHASLIKIPSSLLALVIGSAIIWPGVLGTRASMELLPVYFKVGALPDELDRVHRFSRANEIWPQSEFRQSRAMIHHRHAMSEGTVMNEESLRFAIEDYLAAASHNPKFPAHQVNAANLLSFAGDADPTEKLYEEAIRLQGNMETAFMAHFHQSDHFRRKSIAYFNEGEIGASMRMMERAAGSIEEASEKTAWLSVDAAQLRVVIHESLGVMREAYGDIEGALEAYDFAATLPRGRHVQYRGAMLVLRKANAEWYSRRPATAYPLFVNARERLGHARHNLPEDVTIEEWLKSIRSIDENLRLLRTAGFGE